MGNSLKCSMAHSHDRRAFFAIMGNEQIDLQDKGLFLCIFFSGNIYFQHRFHPFFFSFRVSVFTCLAIPSLHQLYHQLDGPPERSETLARLEASFSE